MTGYIAFLRAINVGGHVVKMETLRALFGELGFANVETFIASGNVFFEARAASARALERKIEQRLEPALGYAVAAFIRTPAEVAAVAQYQPFAAAQVAAAHSLHVGFLPAAPGPEAQRRLEGLRTAADEFACHAREFYWLRRARLGEATITGAQLEKALGMPTTLRNVTTVKKLAARYGQHR